MRKLLLSASILFIFASPAAAYKGDCGHPVSDGDTPTVSDAVYLLKATATSMDCAPEVCDVDSNCRVSVGDALHLLVSAAYGRRDQRCNEGCDEVLVCSDSRAPMCGGYCPDGFGCTEVEKPKKKKRKKVCHKGLIDPWRARTIKVAKWAVEAHLGHGDYLGRCEHETDYTWSDGDPDNADSDSGADSDRDDTDSDSARDHDGDSDSDSDSDSHADSDSDSDSDSDRHKKRRRHKTMCGCRPFEPTSTTTMPEPTTTTTRREPTTTTLPEPTTTTTRREPTTTTLPEPTTTTTMPEPPTTTTTRPGPTTTTIAEPTTTTSAEPTTTTLSEGTTTTTLATDSDNDGMNDSADPCPTDTRNLCYGPVAIDSATALPIRVNANSDPSDICSGMRTDCSGAVWVDDFGFSLPSVSDVCSLPEGCPIAGIEAVFGCTDAATEDLMHCERFANVQSGQPPLGYSYAVANGEYVVNLYFANTFGGTAAPGSRVFDIVIENTVEYASFDQIMAAGGSGIMVVRSAVVNVEDGMLDIGFSAIVENPAVKAIEVLSGPTE